MTVLDRHHRTPAGVRPVARTSTTDTRRPAELRPPFGDDRSATPAGPEMDEARTAPITIIPPGPPATRRRRLPRLPVRDLVRSGAVHQAAGLLSVAGIVVAISTGLPVVALVAAAVAAAAPLAVVTALRLSDDVVDPLGSSALPRTMLALVVLLARGGSVLPAVTCSAIAAAALLEPVLSRVSAAAPPFAANLPGSSVRNHERIAPRLVFLINTVLAVACAAAAVAGAPLGLVLVPALAAVALASAAVGDTLLRLRDRRRAEKELPDLVAALQPAFLVHWDALPGTEYQVTMWLPYLERLGAPFVVVVREPAAFRGLAAVTTVPVIVRQDHRDLDAVVVPTVRAAFYVNNGARNVHLIRFTSMRHIQLNHGESDKAPSYSPVFRLYDKDFVAGRAAIDRFAANGVAMPSELFTIVGRPQVEDILVGDSTSEVPTALYAPTWGGSNADSDYCSLPIGHLVIESLLRRGFRVIFRPHPYTRRDPRHARQADRIESMLATDAKATGRAHCWGADATGRDLVDCFNAAHLLVSDVSSVVPDFLFSEKPFAIVAMHGDPTTFARTFPIASAAYLIDRKARNIELVLDSISGGDPVARSRRAAKSYFLGDFPADRYSEAFVQAARAEIGLG